MSTRMMDQLASIGVEFDETTIDRLFNENKQYYEHPVRNLRSHSL